MEQLETQFGLASFPKVGEAAAADGTTESSADSADSASTAA
jgi:hypothetical protein